MSRKILGAAHFLFLIGFMVVLPTAIAVVGVVFLVNGIRSSIEAMQFEQTHPIVRATVLSVFTNTYTTTDYDPQTHISTSHTETETCADTVKFLAEGREMEVNVKSLLECPVQVGDQPEIAYDPQHPSHFQFVPAGGPFWGNILGAIISLAIGGTCMSGAMWFFSFLVEDWGFQRRRPLALLFANPLIFWWAGMICILIILMCIIAHIVLTVIG